MATIIIPIRPADQAATNRRGLDLCKQALVLAVGRHPDPCPEVTRRQTAAQALARVTSRTKAVQS